LGLTFLLAIMRAILSASRVNKPSGGKVETVLTLWTHRAFFFSVIALPPHPQRFCEAPLSRNRCRTDAKLRIADEGPKDGPHRAAHTIESG
jgi:hypothetical protein